MENTTLRLTEEQSKALEVPRLGPIHVVNPATGDEFVLVRLADFRQLGYDDSPWTREEMLWMLAQSGRAAGWDDPLMDEYDDYDRIMNERQSR